LRALLSVHDKTGLLDLARGLRELGWDLISTGGTQQALAAAGIPVRSVADLTGAAEILGGRVKSLHPKVHGGILARRDLPGHMAELSQAGIEPIDLVAVNLYPFLKVVRGGADLAEALENIDIGGPTLLRAAAKNFTHVLPLVDPTDYDRVLEGLQQGEIPPAERRRLAYKAFQHVAAYDTAIAQYLRDPEQALPDLFTIALSREMELRYGENPHQRGALYLEEGPRPPAGIAAARKLHGKDLSYNNILDADAAWRSVSDFARPTVAVIKHANPCGLASHPDQAEAYRRAHQGDPVSAYGGIVALNRPLGEAAAQEIAKTFYEVVVAPAYEEGALALLKKKRDLRLLQVPPDTDAGLELRKVGGGFLVQEEDRYPDETLELRVVTRKAPTEDQMADLLFAWKAVKHVKSNAIVLAREEMLLGVGAGQPNRVTSVYLALRGAGERARGAVLASDAFFPFADNVELAAQGGIAAIVQPGGSIRDQEVIAAADSHGLAMVFTGVRHFRH